MYPLLICLALLAGLVVLLILRGRRHRMPPLRLDHFDFDHSKRHESEGREFPFSS